MEKTWFRLWKTLLALIADHCSSCQFPFGETLKDRKSLQSHGMSQHVEDKAHVAHSTRM